jgi:dTDP-4-amino-4,6-dideoxygalactose transaminase
MIEFNIPLQLEKQKEYLLDVFTRSKFCGDGFYTKKCNEFLEYSIGVNKALLTSSCTHALEMCAILSDIKPGDEVIMPSYTFVSTANAFVLRGAKIVFVDIRPDTMNIDESKIEAAVTDNTKAIIPVHYAGVSCEMDTISKIAKDNKLLIIEDAAQAIGSFYNNKPVGNQSDMSCLSFHETKNIHSGEGGAILINNKDFIERAEIIREKGTDRSKFIRGQVDKYTWMDLGSSYLPSEFNAAILLAQLEIENKITSKRLEIWNTYYENLQLLKKNNFIELPYIPDNCKHNAHMFYIKVKDINVRQDLISFLIESGISSVFHYIPLHNSYAGLKFGVFNGEDEFTTKESERLLRLPLYYNLSIHEVKFICEQVIKYFSKK